MVLLWVARGQKERRGGGGVCNSSNKSPQEETPELPDGVLKGLPKSSRVAHKRDDPSTFDMLSAAALVQRFEAPRPPRNTPQTKKCFHHEI